MAMQVTAWSAWSLPDRYSLKMELVSLNAAQVGGDVLQPALDSVHDFTNVLLNRGLGRKETVPVTVAVLADDRLTVVGVVAVTVAPSAIPVPYAVIPTTIPAVLLTEMTG